MYVSDFLEEIINAKEIREIVREECVHFTKKLPDHLLSHILPVAEYIGGKCMGYPAVWFIQQALNLSPDDIRKALTSARIALLVSLTTSIADDLIDKDENVSGEHLMFFYLLFFEALSHSSNGYPETCDYIYKEAVGAMDLFVGKNPIKRLKEEKGIEKIRQITRKSGKRIGNFHKMIAFDFLKQFSIKPSNKESLIDLAGCFGEWCSHLDDTIDIERDIQKGDLCTFPITWLIENQPHLKPFLLERSLDELSQYLVSTELTDAVLSHLVHGLERIRKGLEEIGILNLEQKFERISEELPKKIHLMRRAVHNQFMTNNIKRVNN